MVKLPLYRTALLFLVWSLVYVESLISMATVWTQSKTYEHGMAIIPISLWLAWRKKAHLKSANKPAKTDPHYLPLMLIIFPTFLWMMGKAAEIALLKHTAAILSLQLLVWFTLGTKRAKTLLFPIFYLVFCIPFGEAFIPQLQLITADITVFLVQLSGIPIYREGLFLSIPNGMFEVAEACSGIRFLISSIALGCLFSHLSFTKWWKHIVFVAFCFIFPIIANGIRAYGIVLIGYLSDMKYATSADHLIYGWFFFSVVILSIFLIANKFADVQQKAQQKAAPFPAVHKKTLPSSQMQSNLLSLALMLVFSSQIIWKNSLNAPTEQGIHQISLPEHFVQMNHSSWGIHFPNAQQFALAKMAKQEAKQDTQIYIAASNNPAASNEFITHKNQLYNPDHWSLVSSSNQVLENNINVKTLQIVSSNGMQRHLIYWYCINDHCTNSRTVVKLLKAWHVIINNPVELRFTAVLTDDINNNQIKSLAQL